MRSVTSRPGRSVPVAVALALAAALFSAPPTAASDTSEWIVTLRDGVSASAVASGLAADSDATLGFVYDEVLGGFSITATGPAAKALASHPLVQSVSPSRTFELFDSAGMGLFRIDADAAHQPANGNHRGAGARIAVIDSGIDLDHPDLAPNLRADLGQNCVNPGAAPADDNGHGTHVAGIAAAAYGPEGVFSLAGVAPEAELVPVKSFDATGQASTAQVLCGIDHVTALAADGVPIIANMSFGEPGSDSTCDDLDTSDVIHEAICDSRDAGVINVAAAGNNSGPASSFIPAAFDEVITVSALTDFDGAPGGADGCKFDPEFLFDCDDTLAVYSNYGSAVDVMAPGTKILSTIPDDTYGSKSGTSMAAPHVSGVAALMLAADPTLDQAGIEALLKATGECPSPAGAMNTGGLMCDGQGQWQDDPDGVAEPLVNALRAAQAAAGELAFPPAAEFSVSCVDVSCGFVDESVDPDGSVVSWLWDFGDGSTSTVQSPTHVYAGVGFYDVTLTVTDDGGETGAVTRQVVVPAPGQGVQGDWVGVYGADGHVLAAWNSSSDLTSWPLGAVTLEQGSRYRWSANTAAVQALENPTQTLRRAATFYHPSQLRIRLDFTSAYTGPLHIYALDWDTANRRQVVTVDDGVDTYTIELDTPFNQGMWMHFPVDVGPGGTVTITATRNAGYNAVISGIFLGDA